MPGQGPEGHAACMTGLRQALQDDPSGRMVTPPAPTASTLYFARRPNGRNQRGP